MQGFIININKVKDEDLIVTILTDHKVYTLYRFYGARHSTVNVGFKIDFEIESTMKSTISRLKDVLHLGYPWILDHTKLYHWQQYIKLFYNHLKDVDSIDSFYFELLNNLSHRLIRQNSKRAILENYITLCKFEGRLHTDFRCLLCDDIIENKITLIRGFTPTHSYCSYGKEIELNSVKMLFMDENSIALSDKECDYLWDILLQGL